MKKESQAKIASLIDKFEWAIEKGKELDYNMILSELNAINFIECTSGVGGKFNIFDYSDPKGGRPQLSGVYYSEGVAVATDAHVLCVVEAAYPEEFEGKIVKKDRSFVEDGYKFPNYRLVIPKDVEVEFTLDVNELGELNRKFLADKKLRKNIHFDVKEGQDVLTKTFKIKTSKTERLFNFDYMKHIVNFLNEYPNSVVALSPQGEMTIRQGNNLLLVMSVISKDETFIDNLGYIIQAKEK